MKHTTRTALPALAVAAALLLAGCGGGDSETSGHGASHGASKSSAAPARTAFNDADVAFAQGMIPHHRQALEMADLVAGRSSDAEVKTLAEQIRRAQDPEIATLTRWLGEWQQPVPGAHVGHGGGDDGNGGHTMSGMMTEAQLTDLKAAKGPAFDKAFAELMIEHHEGALTMARDVLAKGEAPGVRTLAEAVVKGQSAEIAQLRTIIARL
ncbi:DUF305 domain-containing protein [Streptomyces polyrhachis]|uniref:DUF305 domain-containing protein n=1 Tax=Streptomyces polyrhachis TaxID=1282885 RepID=A0ABW2GIE1_9ACTN